MNKVVIITGQTVLSSFRAKLSASEIIKIHVKYNLQVRIKNDLDGLGVSRLSWSFFLIWQQILRISEVEKSLILKGFRV